MHTFLALVDMDRFENQSQNSLVPFHCVKERYGCLNRLCCTLLVEAEVLLGSQPKSLFLCLIADGTLQVTSFVCNAIKFVFISCCLFLAYIDQAFVR